MGHDSEAIFLDFLVLVDQPGKLTLESVGVLQERVLQKLFCAGSLGHVLRQALVHEVLKLRRPSLVEDGSGSTQDVRNYFALALLDVGRVPLGEFDGQDAVAPDID